MQKDGTPLIIFVDELDRCRPDFAIEVLERIKHVFNVENIIFILGIDKEALSNSVKSIYGENTKINGYLSRFIDLEVNLEPSKFEDVQYIKYLFEDERYKFNEISIRFNLDFGQFIIVCTNIISAFEFPFRELEKLITKLYFILSSFNVDGYDLSILLYMLSLSLKNREKFNDVIDGSVSIMEVFNSNKNEHINDDICYSMAILLLIFDEPIESIDHLMFEKSDKDYVKSCFDRQLSSAPYFKRRFNEIIKAIKNSTNYSVIGI